MQATCFNSYKGKIVIRFGFIKIISLSASIPIKEKLLSVKKVMIYGAISFNSYKGKIVIRFF